MSSDFVLRPLTSTNSTLSGSLTFAEDITELIDDTRAREVAENIQSLLSVEMGRPGPAPNPLTDRELEVLRLLALSLEDAEIADQLGISPLTVQTHIRNARKKLNAKNRMEAILIALHRGLL